jgi:hypothetical protein
VVTDARSTSLLNELGVAQLAATPDGSADCFPDHADGRVVAIAGYTIDCYDAPLGTLTHQLHAADQASAWYVRFSSDGKCAVVTGFADGTTQAGLGVPVALRALCPRRRGRTRRREAVWHPNCGDPIQAPQLGPSRANGSPDRTQRA